MTQSHLKDEANILLTEAKFALTNRYNEKEFFETPNWEEVDRFTKTILNGSMNIKTWLKIVLGDP
jgi:hypothetical protein